MTGASRTHRTDLPSWSQRCHPTPKPAGTTDAPCLPSRQEDCLCLPPPFHHSHRTCPPGAGTLPFVSRHDGCALSGSCLQRVRDTSRPGVGLSTGKGRPAAPPCPSAWTRWLRDADGRNAADGQAPEPGLPPPRIRPPLDRRPAIMSPALKGGRMRQCMDAENLHRRMKKLMGQLQAIDQMIDKDGLGSIP